MSVNILSKNAKYLVIIIMNFYGSKMFKLNGFISTSTSFDIIIGSPSMFAKLSDPPVTKSCLNHRLRKLMELAEKEENE